VSKDFNSDGQEHFRSRSIDASKAAILA
jgi:hypothetical protein